MSPKAYTSVKASRPVFRSGRRLSANLGTRFRRDREVSRARWHRCALTMLGEINDGGADARAVEEVAARWHEAGREVLLVEMLAGDDLNDVWREVAS